MLYPRRNSTRFEPSTSPQQKPTHQWISHVFQECIYSLKEKASFYVGLSSIFLWLVAQVPQILKNIRTQSAEALSAWFIFE